MENLKKNYHKLGIILPKLSLPADLEELKVTGLNIDSREIKPGNIFIALNGEKDDGNHYIKEALDNGAILVLTDNLSIQNKVKVFFYPNLSREVGIIASFFYGQPSNQLDIFCVTGTNGKTSYVESLSQMLNKIGVKNGYLSTIKASLNGNKLYNSKLTTPDPVFLQKMFHQFVLSDCKIAAIEASSHGIIQNRISGTKIKVAVLSSFSQDHLDYHKTIESYEEAKKSLFLRESIENYLINIDSNFGERLYQELKISNKKVYSISTSKDAEFRIKFIQKPISKLTVEMETPFGYINFRLNTFSEMMALNISLAMASLTLIDIPLAKLSEVAEDISLSEGRMEVIEINKSSRCIIDYAHTPDALFRALKEIKNNFPGKVWCLFGCGGQRDKLKRSLMGKIAEELSDHIILTNDNPRYEAPRDIINEILVGMENVNSLHIEEDRKLAIEYGLKEIISSDEPISLLIAGKGHEDFQLIDGKSIPLKDRNIVLDSLDF